MKIITSKTANEPDHVFISESKEYLELLNCGLYDLRNTASMFACKREKGFCKNYMLQILLSGKALHQIEEETHVLHAGQCILYEPNQPQNIIHYGTDNPSYIWLHFCGQGASQIVSDLKLNGIHTLKNCSYFSKKLIQLVNEKRTSMPNKNYLCQSLLLNYLVKLSHSFKENASLSKSASKIEPAISHITYHYMEQRLSNQDYAKMCFLSESRFLHIFKEVTGVTPNKYIEQRRISAAKELLTSTTYSISDIAELIGYDDVYYFSRVFKKNIGISPQSFKKQCKKQLFNEQ